ncbi:MAG: hypothetical protein RLZZ232_3509 [Planctomycetota bacterium]
MRTLAVQGTGYETPNPVQSRYRPGSRIAILKPAAFRRISRGMSGMRRKNGPRGGIGMDCPVRLRGNRSLFPESPTQFLTSPLGHFIRWEPRAGDVAAPDSETGCPARCAEGRTHRNRFRGFGGLTESRRCVRDPHPSRQRSGHRTLSALCPDRRQRTFCRKGHRGWRRP